MTFLETIFGRLRKDANAPVLREIRDGRIVGATGGELLALIGQARAFLGTCGLKKGDRCAFLASNGIRWAAMDLAMMAEGIIVVPLYTRQAPAELAGMMEDAVPARIFCDDASIAREILKIGPQAPEITALESVWGGASRGTDGEPYRHGDGDTVAIIYTSGTSGEPKGVALNAGGVNHILGCTNQRLDALMGKQPAPEQIFHYAPFCFAASWILLLTALSRNSVLTLSTDLSKLADDLKITAPHYFLNVPTLLERVRSRIEETIGKKGGATAGIFNRAKRAYAARGTGHGSAIDSACLAIANQLMFPTIRKTIGPNLKALICGSAPLAVETQLFFMMIGIPVLQVYGLTETTAICTMDHPGQVEPGRVGAAIPGVEMRVAAESGEVLVRGPNVFAGYWRRPNETARALEGGWFHTGDQGEMNEKGNWRISGRLKNLIILNSGHNIAPEPIEHALASRLPGAQQVVLVGDRRSFLAALVAIPSANGSHSGLVQRAIDAVNGELPHYKQIRAFRLLPESFSNENGLLTVMGKVKRDAVSARYASEIEDMFKKKPA